MAILIISIFLGITTFIIGGYTGSEAFAIIFGISGFFAPAFYILEKIYVNIDKENK